MDDLKSPPKPHTVALLDAIPAPPPPSDKIAQYTEKAINETMKLSDSEVSDLEAVSELLQALLPMAEEYRMENYHSDISESDLILAILAKTFCVEK